MLTLFRHRHRLPRLGRWPRWALVGVCLLLAASSAAQAQATRRTSATTAHGVPVVVATRDLGTGHLLSAADLMTIRAPSAVVSRDAVSAPRLVLGRRLAAPITRHEVLTAARLLGRDVVTGMPAGQVALPLPVADGRVADLVHAGDRVQVLTAGARNDLAASATSTASSTSAGRGGTVVADNLRVLAVLPGTDVTPGTELVLAASVEMSQQLVRASHEQMLAVVIEPP